MCYFGGSGSQTKRQPRKTGKEVVNKAMNDLHVKMSDSMDQSKWRIMTRGNMSDSNSVSDADS